ncbi:MAG: hypothetical protein ACOVLC_05990 [Flavobacterium sp.]
MEKIFVYDTHRAYARLIKLEFGKTHDIHCPQNYDSYSAIDFKQFSFAFVIIHDYEELISIIPIMQTVPNIIVGSKLKNIEEVSKFSYNMMYIDISLPKHELLSELNNLFKLFANESNNSNV